MIMSFKGSCILVELLVASMLGLANRQRFKFLVSLEFSCDFGSFLLDTCKLSKGISWGVVKLMGPTCLH